MTRFTSNLETNHLLYTDSQGQEILERKLNSRDWTTKYPISEPIAMNYYPMNAIGFIKDQSRQFTYIFLILSFYYFLVLYLIEVEVVQVWKMVNLKLCFIEGI